MCHSKPIGAVTAQALAAIVKGSLYSPAATRGEIM